MGRRSGFALFQAARNLALASSSVAAVKGHVRDQAPGLDVFQIGVNRRKTVLLHQLSYERTLPC
jgi:hypothetical protein